MYDTKLDDFAFELLKYLYKTFDYTGDRLSTDVFVFCNKNLYYIDEEKSHKKIPIYIEKNINVEDYLKYYEKDSLNFIMEGRLNEYLYYYDVDEAEKVSNQIEKIFQKYGYYLDFGSSIIVMAKKISNSLNYIED